jgi:hypothetical protein
MTELERLHRLLKFGDLLGARTERAAQAAHGTGPNAGPAMLNPVDSRNPYPGMQGKI